LAAIRRYLTAYQFPHEHTLLRLDGQYGNGAVLTDMAGFIFVTRGKDYHLPAILCRKSSYDFPRSFSLFHRPSDLISRLIHVRSEKFEAVDAV
jgi:hypothetical protein